MKKTLLYFFILIALALSSKMVSQTIPTSGFETWVNNTETGTTYEVPQNWIAADMINRSFNANYTGAAVTKTTQSHTGTYAALMQTVISGGDTTSGILASVNTFNQFASVLFGGPGTLGFPCAQRPAFITGFYKLTSIGADVGLVFAMLTKWNTTLNRRDTLGSGGGNITLNASSYSTFSFPITYTLNLFPDTALLWVGMEGLGGKKSHVGTMLFIDDLAFTGSVPFGVKRYVQNGLYTNLYPDPVIQTATISVDPAVMLTRAEILVFDLAGHEVKRMDKVSQQTTIEKEDLSPGIYFYQLVNEGVSVSRGKFVIE